MLLKYHIKHIKNSQIKYLLFAEELFW